MVLLGITHSVLPFARWECDTDFFRFQLFQVVDVGAWLKMAMELFPTCFALENC